MSEEWKVRRFQPSDHAGLIALWKECELVRKQNDPDSDIESEVQHDVAGLLVAASEDAVVGSVMVGYDGHRGWINYLAVTPGLRRSGIGRRLMAAAEQQLQELGCPKVNLQVRSSNLSVLDFYGELGYTVDDVVSMGKRLTK